MERRDVWAAGDLYEPYVGRWSRLVAREFLSWLLVPAGKDWLDVGCGTGALSQMILETATPHAVRGVDPSAGFIEYAKARITSPLASFEIGDAQSLPVDSTSFDVAVAGLVLNFVPDSSGAVVEMTRAVRPGGAVAAYVWDYAGKMELMRYFWDAAVALDPRLSISTRAAGFQSARRSRFPNCSHRRDYVRWRCVRLTFPRGFAISMITGLHSSGGKGLRPATPCRLARIGATRSALEFARNSRSRRTEQ
jgi:SAM-dependent methyltransferase